MRFIILGNARTGSNFLASLLKTYPQVKIREELFNLNGLDRKDLKNVLEDPVEYLKSRLYVEDQPEINAIGFKIFYYHATQEQLYPENYPDKNVIYAPERLKSRIQSFQAYIQNNFDLKELGQKMEQVWEYLRNDKELRVLHLKRKNKLETFLSLRRAFMTDQWVKHSSIKMRMLNWVNGISKKNTGTRKAKKAQGARKSVYLSYEDCLESFEKATTWEKEYDEAFQNHKHVEIFYEDLCADTDSEMRKISRSLEIPDAAKIKTSLMKQNRQPLSQSISNYWDLKEKFKNTSWQEFFTD